MPRKTRSKNQSDSPAGEPLAAPLETLKEQYGLKTGTELAQEQLTAYEAQPLEYTKPGETLLQESDYKLAKYERPAAQIKTARPHEGGAIGRGRQFKGEGENWVLRAGKNPLIAREVDFMQRHGFDVTSPDEQPVTEMVGSRKTVREQGDYNLVQRVIVGEKAGRSR